MYTLVSYMYNFDSVQITVVLNVQNFGKCLSMSHVDALMQRAENVVLKEIFNIK
jgi:hypothetical protein